jgi:hypothetical protein
MTGACLLAQWQMGLHIAELVDENVIFIKNVTAVHSIMCVRAFDISLFIAMATLAPLQEIQLMFVFPVQLRWVALVTVAVTIFLALRHLSITWPMFVGFVPWLVFFGRDVYRRWHSQANQKKRKRIFTAQIQTQEGEPFHTCAQCGNNDLTHPQLEFRLLPDNTELCVECLKKNAVSASPPQS